MFNDDQSYTEFLALTPDYKVFWEVQQNLQLECWTSREAWYKKTDSVRANWDKIRTYNNRRNNDFMIFQRWRLKLINSLLGNRLIN